MKIEALKAIDLTEGTRDLQGSGEAIQSSRFNIQHSKGRASGMGLSAPFES
ncbi:hypothetical protein [Thioalkalivibrio denitrificans]|uniref:hypothetical protein n=1 Tax=Thioalkalivibrio denitrificans TaxID=108003 RepID=UPI00158D50B6|nr:hypothetical protein [Thioalkalivibrio denitrificans]